MQNEEQVKNWRSQCRIHRFFIEYPIFKKNDAYKRLSERMVSPPSGKSSEIVSINRMACAIAAREKKWRGEIEEREGILRDRQWKVAGGHDCNDREQLVTHFEDLASPFKKRFTPFLIQLLVDRPFYFRPTQNLWRFQ